MGFQSEVSDLKDYTITASNNIIKDCFLIFIVQVHQHLCNWTTLLFKVK